MATTTNYSWTTPDDTDLVKDGASAIRTLGSSVDTTVKNLNPETTTGAISYRGATANQKVALPIGTAGQVLTVNSGATAPEWATVSAGGMTLIQETVANANTGIDFTSISGSYKQLLLVWCGIFHSTGGSEFAVRLNNNSGSIYVVKGLRWADSNPTVIETATESSIQNTGDVPPFGGGSTSNTLHETAMGTLLIDNYASTTKLKEFSAHYGFRRIGVGSRLAHFNGIFNSTSAVTSLNIVRMTGSATMSNATNTSIRLYGLS